MKKILIALAAALMWAPALLGQETSSGVKVSNVEFAYEDGNLVVSMVMDFSAVTPARNTAIIYTPVVYSGLRMQELPTAGIYSRGRFYSYAREKRNPNPLPVNHYYVKDMPSTLHYTGVVQWADWMDGAKLRIDHYSIGCCGETGWNQHGFGIEGVRVPDLAPAPEPVP
ncbi:MAG: hypothetical protein J5835_07420, partial [Bacteroidales bacterium]|nr:hypothetical protein [Bacteroidales bacterium]